MTRKIQALKDYIPAGEAAQILSQKLGRTVAPDYIHKLKNVRLFQVNRTTRLYHRGDIATATIRKRASQAVP